MSKDTPSHWTNENTRVLKCRPVEMNVIKSSNGAGQLVLMHNVTARAVRMLLYVFLNNGTVVLKH